MYEFKRWSTSTTLPQTLLMFVLTLMIGSTVVGAVATKDGICQSMDIRNHPRRLEALRDCRVIEGFLMISLIEDVNEANYSGLTFPNLVEITDFLLMYRVEGLTTLVHLFPNLRVIRGSSLVNNYALIIYELPQLQEIGLKGLTTISRGYVRIEKNPLLCFVDTIDWTYIAHGSQLEDHFFDANRNPGECPVCSTGGNIEGEIECPTRAPNTRLCWNRQTCQKVCPDSCGGDACDDNLNCCDTHCLGSCNADRANCTVCRSLYVGQMTALQCVDKCPSGFYQYENRRCITDLECLNMTIPFGRRTDFSGKPFIPFNGMCTESCPEQYLEIELEDGRRSCRNCNGTCKKKCSGGIIENLAAAHTYRGCQIITADLILSIRQGGPYFVEQLEDALSSIEEINGALKITRSLSLVSLRFFKNLRIIHGRRLTDSYALTVMDNPNLQILFDHQVIIAQGKLFFHFNPMLCYNVIKRLKDDTNDLKNVDKLAVEDVAHNSNGDKVACNVTPLSAETATILPFGAIIEVSAKQFKDSQALRSYVLHLKPTLFRNVSEFHNPHICGGDGWRVEETTGFNRISDNVQMVITRLKPYTLYAYYVKTYTIQPDQSEGRTDILYFRTLPWQPDVVQGMRVMPRGSSSLVVNWAPPKKANGELTNYIVRATLVRDDEEAVFKRNYCEKPLKFGGEKSFVKPKPDVPVPVPYSECICPEDDEFDIPPKIFEDSHIAEQTNYFENEIQNLVYVKRHRRTTDTATKYFFPSNSARLEEPEIKTKMNENGEFEIFYSDETAADIHTFTLTKLRHYSMYVVSVQACRDFTDQYFDITTHCSNVVVNSVRTGKMDNADDVPYLEIRTSNSSSLRNLYWSEPKRPNGLILSYTVAYKRIDLDNIRPIEYCVTSRMYKESNGVISMIRLSNGNYSVSVKATSMAGDGRSSPSETVFMNE